MGTLHFVVSVRGFFSTVGFFRYLCKWLGEWLPAWLVFFTVFLFLTLALRDYVTYYQAQGLSGHTSPCGECVFSHFGAMPRDWLPAQLVLCFSLLWTLAPRDYVTYY